MGCNNIWNMVESGLKKKTSDSSFGSSTISWVAKHHGSQTWLNPWGALENIGSYRLTLLTALQPPSVTIVPHIWTSWWESLGTPAFSTQAGDSNHTRPRPPVGDFTSAHPPITIKTLVGVFFPCFPKPFWTILGTLPCSPQKNPVT